MKGETPIAVVTRVAAEAGHTLGASEAKAFIVGFSLGRLESLVTTRKHDGETIYVTNVERIEEIARKIYRKEEKA